MTLKEIGAIPHWESQILEQLTFGSHPLWGHPWILNKWTEVHIIKYNSYGYWNRSSLRFQRLLWINFGSTPLSLWGHPWRTKKEFEASETNASFNSSERRGLVSHICLRGGGFQQYHKSFRIGHKPFYSQVNDKEWLKNKIRGLQLPFQCEDMPKSVDRIDNRSDVSDIISHQNGNYISLVLFCYQFLPFTWL